MIFSFDKKTLFFCTYPVDIVHCTEPSDSGDKYPLCTWASLLCAMGKLNLNLVWLVWFGLVQIDLDWFGLVWLGRDCCICGVVW